MKSTTACDDQLSPDPAAAEDLVIRTPEGVLVKGKLYVKPPAPPAPPPPIYGTISLEPPIGKPLADLVTKLQDPTAVYAAMLRGDIAKLSWRQMVHLCGPVPNTADEQMAEIVRLRSEVKELAADIERYIGINAELATELTKLREQKPVAHIDYWKSDGTLIARRQETSGGKLYAAPVPAPAVPADLNIVHELLVALKGVVRWVPFRDWKHTDEPRLAVVQAESVISKTEALLQSAPQAPAAPEEWRDFAQKAKWYFDGTPVCNNTALSVMASALLQSAEVRHD